MEAEVLYDFVTDNDDELCLRVGEIVTISSKVFRTKQRILGQGSETQKKYSQCWWSWQFKNRLRFSWIVLMSI